MIWMHAIIISITCAIVIKISNSYVESKVRTTKRRLIMQNTDPVKNPFKEYPILSIDYSSGLVWFIGEEDKVDSVSLDGLLMTYGPSIGEGMLRAQYVDKIIPTNRYESLALADIKTGYVNMALIKAKPQT